MTEPERIPPLTDDEITAINQSFARIAHACRVPSGRVTKLSEYAMSNILGDAAYVSASRSGRDGVAYRLTFETFNPDTIVAMLEATP